MSSVFDKIGASVPLDRQAAVSTSRGEHYTPRNALPCVHSQMPLPVRPVPKITGPQFEDFTGRSLGLLRVVGLYDEPSRAKDKQAMWVVRCVCGDYETRSSKSLRKAVSGRCEQCNRVEQMRHRGEKIARGVIPATTVEDFMKRQRS